MGNIRRNSRGFFTGITALASMVETLPVHRDIVIKAAHTLDPGIIDLQATWRRVRARGVTVARYVSNGPQGTESSAKSSKRRTS